MLPAFSVASQSLIAGPLPVPGAIPRVPREHHHPQASSPAALAPSIPPALRQADTPDPVAQAPVVPELGQDLARAQDSVDPLAPAALADPVPAARAEAHLRPAKRRARSALLPAEAAVDVRNIRRPKKAQ